MLSLDAPPRRRPGIRLSESYWPGGEQMPYYLGRIKAAVRRRLAPERAGQARRVRFLALGLPLPDCFDYF